MRFLRQLANVSIAKSRVVSAKDLGVPTPLALTRNEQFGSWNTLMYLFFTTLHKETIPRQGDREFAIICWLGDNQDERPTYCSLSKARQNSAGVLTPFHPVVWWIL